jgi:hypothetical protein
VKALLRKDLPWSWALACAGTASFTIALGSEGFEAAWLFPPTRLEGLFHVAWICGLALGLCAGWWDELLGTRDFLRHRPVSATRLHAGRVISCVIVLLVWLVLPPLLHWSQETLFGEYAGLTQFGRIADVWAFESAALSATAVGLFAASLPCGPLLRLFVAGAALFSTFLVAMQTSSCGFPGIQDPVWFAGCHVAGALVFGAASFALPLRDADRDRPWTGGQGRVRAAVVALALAGAATFGLSALQHELLQVYRQAQPFLVEDGERVLLARYRDHQRRAPLQPVDADHRPVGEPLDRARARSLWTPRDARFAVYRDPWFEEPRFRDARDAYWGHGDSWTVWGRTRLDGDGTAWVLRTERHTRAHEFFATGKGPQRVPFARDAQIVRLRGEGAERNPHWIIEPGSPSAWRMRPGEDHYTAVPLPGGDRIVKIAALRPPGDVEDQVQVGGFRYRLQSQDAEGLVGERGHYVFQGDELLPAPNWLRKPGDEAPRTHRVRVLDHDLLSPRVVVEDAAGRSRLEHGFAPRTGGERLAAGLLLCASALRPLPLQAAAWTAPLGREALWLDPLLAEGRRPWLLLLTLGVGALAALGAHRRLGRLGAPISTRRFWCVASLLTGPAGLFASVLIEPRRAYATPAEAGIHAPPPRIAALQPS